MVCVLLQSTVLTLLNIKTQGALVSSLSGYCCVLHRKIRSGQADHVDQCFFVLTGFMAFFLIVMTNMGIFSLFSVRRLLFWLFPYVQGLTRGRFLNIDALVEVHSIIKDPYHLGHLLYNHLPPGMRYRSICSRTYNHVFKSKISTFAVFIFKINKKKSNLS